MKAVLIGFVVISLVAVGRSEPPAGNYLPPGQGGYSSPSQNYGAPSNGHNSRPSQNYGAPSQNYGAPSQAYGAPNGGYAGNGDEHNEPANYNFEYMVKDEHYGTDFGHKESRQGDKAEGEYYVLLPDGRKQIVRYEADEKGYRPTITYEEAGGYGIGPANGGYSSGRSNNGGYPSGPY